jgi:hypothetical protein
VPEEPKPPTTAPRPPTAPPSVLQKESDQAARPGFRSPPNKKSKAQKKKK